MMNPASTIPVSSESAQPPAQAEHRRGTRLFVAVPVILAGKDAEGRKFREESRTLSISRTGATIETSRVIVPGAELLIKNPSLGITVRARAVRLTQRASQLSLLAVELFDLKNVWGIQYPPQDWRLSPPAAVKREKAPASAAPAKVIEIDLSGPLTASLADSERSEPGPNPKDALERPEEECRTLPDIEAELRDLVQTAVNFSACLESLLSRTQEASRRIREGTEASPKHTDPDSGEEQIALAAQDMIEKFTSQLGEADRRIRAAQHSQRTETLRRPARDAAKVISRRP
ncbi:MAG: hypothetical protein ACRD2G_06795 [Terriglobia bacterium]